MLHVRIRVHQLVRLTVPTLASIRAKVNVWDALVLVIPLHQIKPIPHLLVVTAVRLNVLTFALTVVKARAEIIVPQNVV